MDDQKSAETIIMAALSTLTPPQLSDLVHSISTVFRRQQHRLITLISSPYLFSLTLHHLHSLPLRHKSLLIARHLLSNLTILSHFILQKNNTLPPPMKLRDLDAVLLLMLLCELRQNDPQALETSPSEWCLVLGDYLLGRMLKLSSIEASRHEVLAKYIATVATCTKFVDVMGFGGGKEEGEVAASVATVVALPSVEVTDGGRECVICKEEMRKGRDVCMLPCDHTFHWICILPWLKKRNTCPCCRHRLPTDDTFGEIRRLWHLLANIGGLTLYRESQCTYR